MLEVSSMVRWRKKMRILRAREDLFISSSRTCFSILWEAYREYTFLLGTSRHVGGSYAGPYHNIEIRGYLNTSEIVVISLIERCSADYLRAVDRPSFHSVFSQFLLCILLLGFIKRMGPIPHATRSAVGIIQAQGILITCRHCHNL